MIRRWDLGDFRSIYEIVNDASRAYQGVIPPDCWKEPYMSEEELRHEMEEGVRLWGYEEESNLVGVMGTQQVEDVTLIRHAYVRTHRRRQGIGTRLLTHLKERTTNPILVGTWADALWAIQFYESHGFRKVGPEEKDSLLRKYWSISERQIETSVVLAESGWIESVKPPDKRA